MEQSRGMAAEQIECLGALVALVARTPRLQSATRCAHASLVNKLHR